MDGLTIIITLMFKSINNHLLQIFHSKYVFFFHIACIFGWIILAFILLRIKIILKEKNILNERLKVSEEKYKMVIENIKEGIVIVQNAIIKFTNNGIESMVEYSKDELISTSIYDYVADEDKKLIQENYHKRISGRNIKKLEYRIITNSRKIIWVESNSVDIEWEKQPATLHFISNITRRKQDEKKIQEHTIFLQNLIDTIPNPVYYKNTEEYFHICNRAFLDFIGIKKDMIIGKKYSFIADTELASIHKDMDFKTLESKSLQQFENKLISSQGTIHECIFYKAPYFNSNGNISGILTVVVDITVRKNAEMELNAQKENLEKIVSERTKKLIEANLLLQKDILKQQFIENRLRENEEKYRTLFNYSNDAIILIFNNSKQSSNLIIDVNKTANNLFEYSRVEFLSLTVDKILDSSSINIFESNKNSLNESNQIIHEIKVKNKTGKCISVEMRMKKIPFKDKNMILIVMRDITVKIEAEEKEHSYKKRLRTLSKELSIAEERERRKIAEGIHNHISQSLVVVKIKILEILEKCSTLNRKKELENLIRIIDETIECSRSLTFELSPPILYELGLIPAVEWLAEYYSEQYRLNIQVQISEISIKFILQLDNDTKTFIFKTIREFIFNVFKHAKAKNIQIIFSTINNNILISVLDDGIGFDTSILKKNKGFGLFSVKERLVLLGGGLDIISKIGKGTSITIKIPFDLDLHQMM